MLARADAHTDRIAELLKGNARLDHLHGALVPLELTYHEFWLRYFYREHVLRTTFALLDADEQQRNALRAARAVADDAESAVTAPAPPALAPVAAAASSLASNASSVDFGFPKPPSAALPMPQPPPLDGATTAGDADVGAATPLRERLAHVDSETSWEQVDDAPPAETDTPGEQSARAPAPALARAAPPADDEDGWGEWS